MNVYESLTLIDKQPHVRNEYKKAHFGWEQLIKRLRIHQRHLEEPLNSTQFYLKKISKLNLNNKLFKKKLSFHLFVIIKLVL